MERLFYLPMSSYYNSLNFDLLYWNWYSATRSGNILSFELNFLSPSIELFFRISTDDMPEKTPGENIQELYRLLQRTALENAGFAEVPLEHLMIRKSQRSPSLRLRFGRSDPRLSVSIPSHFSITSPIFTHAFFNAEFYGIAAFNE